MRSPGAKLIIFAAILVLISAPIAWFVFSLPQQQRSAALSGSATFLGYTNDTSGARLARFAVTNLSAFTVARAPTCLICAPVSGGVWMPLSGILLPPFPRAKELAAGRSEVIAIPPPTNHSPWRISFSISNDAGPAWVGKRLINAILVRLGLPARYGVASLQVDSGPVKDR